MSSLTITGVPEHFNYPIIEAIKKLKSEILVDWEYSPGGTGEMLNKLNENSCQAGILLTEGFLKTIPEENPNLFFVDFYVSSPLVWGIHTGFDSKKNHAAELTDSPVLISRKNSGSHLMYTLLQKELNQSFTPKFEEIKNLNGAIDFASQHPDFTFLWEKFTTKPYCKKGSFKRIGELPTPWPAFSIVVNKSTMNLWGKPALIELFNTLKKDVLSKLSQATIIEEIASFAKLSEPEIATWFAATHWYQTKNSLEKLQNAQDILLQVGLIDAKVDIPVI